MNYLLISSVCLALSYLFYYFLLRNETNFKQVRLFLLSAILFSLFMPFSNLYINLNLSKRETTETKILDEQLQLQYAKTNKESVPAITPNTPEVNNQHKAKQPLISRIDWKNTLSLLYIIISGILFTRLLIQLIRLRIYYRNSGKTQTGNLRILRGEKIKTAFSFFNLIFLPNNISTSADEDKIIQHEKTHANQYHSIDNLLIELLSAVMWFNPFVWMIRNSMQLVHEYLADEGALSTGIDKLGYQALLLNQITEERLICLSSGFNHSLKKRMIMMTKSKFNQKSYLKILSLLPLVALMLFGVGCVKGQNNDKVIAAVAPVRMNVLYIGVNNPMQIAVSGHKASELEVSVDNGKISGKDGEYIINPEKPGPCMVNVSQNGKVIKQSEFRVKFVPDPVAAINITENGASKMVNNGRISKKSILETKGPEVLLRNFDFDLSFTIVSFVLSSSVPNSTIVREEISHSYAYSDLQKDLLNSLIVNQKIMFEEIKAKGPDGKIRKLSPMVFTISE